MVAAGDLGTREKVLSKLIELADILSDRLGNLISFMAVMEGLALPQVNIKFVYNTLTLLCVLCDKRNVRLKFVIRSLILLESVQSRSMSIYRG